MEKARGSRGTPHALSGCGPERTSEHSGPALPRPRLELCGPLPPQRTRRPRYGPAHGKRGYSPPSTLRSDTAPRPAPSRLFIAVLGSNFCPGSRRDQTLLPVCREGVNAFYQPATFARAVATHAGERGIEKGRRGSLWFWPEHRVGWADLIPTRLPSPAGIF